MSDIEHAAPHQHHATPDFSRQQTKRATRSRKIFSLLPSLFLMITVVFLILVNIAGTSTSTLTSIYFLRIDLSNIVPLSVPNAQLLNSIAQSIGLHDFYQVYLWGLCEGYNHQGVTFCSRPKTLFYFNPIEILRNELLAGASIQLPADITTILDLIRHVSTWIFIFFLTSTLVSLILIPLLPLDLSRSLSLPLTILTFLNALLVTVACILSTALYVVFHNVIEGVAELNIVAEIGVRMFVFMWLAAAFAILAWVVRLGMGCCCCASRRDVRSGRREGGKMVYTPDSAFSAEEQTASKRRVWKKDE